MSETGPLIKALMSQHVGKTLHQISVPSAVLDLAKLEINCQRMIEATKQLGLLWRAHIKTHKTTELTRLQVGDNDDTPANLVVSTVVEAENIAPLLQEYKSKGRPVNILYSFPLHSSAISRLSSIANKLGPGSLSVMIDHETQISLLSSLSKPLVFLKVDTGYHRAGVLPEASGPLVAALLAAEAAGACVLHGVYSHASHSYGARNDWAAMALLATEFRGAAVVADEIVRQRGQNHPPLVLSVGATPTATTIQHPALGGGGGGDNDPATEDMADLLRGITASGFALEVHAGVYPTLDLQQLATHARDSRLMAADDIALSVLVEVASLYPGRGAGGTTEALVTAGSLALGREPVQDKGEPPGRDYAGWGIVAPWNCGNLAPGADFPAVHGGWQVGRISQEHGILVWVGEKEKEVELHIGQRLRVWPNHACIAGAGFDYYLIVDSRLRGREDEVIAVWPRWRGW